MLIIGNILSFFAALCLTLSSVVNKRKTVFVFQLCECLLLAAASVFFNSYAGMTSLVLCAIRNILVIKDCFKKRHMYIFLAATLILGVITNNRGFIGMMPVAATLQFTYCSYAFTSLLKTRLSIFFNTLIWVIYSFIIQDYVTAVVDMGTLVSSGITSVKLIVIQRRSF